MRYSYFNREVKRGVTMCDEQSVITRSYSFDRRRKYAFDKRTKFINGVLHIKPIAFNESQFFVVCPMCGEIHIHGRGTDRKAYGARLSHCTSEMMEALDIEHECYIIEPGAEYGK